MSSISNIRSELGGIRPGKPLSPYARWAGIVIFARSPTLSWDTPTSNPGITCSAPNLNRNGFPGECYLVIPSLSKRLDCLVSQFAYLDLGKSQSAFHWLRTLMEIILWRDLYRIVRITGVVHGDGVSGFRVVDSISCGVDLHIDCVPRHSTSDERLDVKGVHG